MWSRFVDKHMQLCIKKRWLAGLMTHHYKKLPVTMKMWMQFYVMVKNLNSVTFLWLVGFDDWFDFFEASMERFSFMCLSPKCWHFLQEPKIRDGRRRHLVNIHLGTKASIMFLYTLFRLIRPRGFRIGHYFHVGISFDHEDSKYDIIFM